jgi:hypothetical protein
MKVICDPFYLKLIVVITLVDIGNNINYTGTTYALAQIGWDYGLNCILIGSVELVSYIFLSSPNSMQISSSLDFLAGKDYCSAMEFLRFWEYRLSINH